MASAITLEGFRPRFMPEPAAYRWIKTDCGRAKYAELAARDGLPARLRLSWFVAVAALRDWRLPAAQGASAAARSVE